MNNVHAMKTRELILQRTLTLLLKKGYDGVSVSDIQSGLDIARGLLYHYFGNKDELFAEIVEKKVLDLIFLEREPLKHHTIGEMILFVLQRYERVLSVLRADTEEDINWLQLNFLVYQSVHYHEHLLRKFREIQEALFIVWKTAVLNSFVKGELKSGLNLESLAHQFVYLTQGVPFAAYAGEKSREVLSELEKGLRDFYEIIKR